MITKGVKKKGKTYKSNSVTLGVGEQKQPLGIYNDPMQLNKSSPADQKLNSPLLGIPNQAQAVSDENLGAKKYQKKQKKLKKSKRRDGNKSVEVIDLSKSQESDHDSDSQPQKGNQKHFKTN